jgi:hypothetical protein
MRDRDGPSRPGALVQKLRRRHEVLRVERKGTWPSLRCQGLAATAAEAGLAAPSGNSRGLTEAWPAPVAKSRDASADGRIVESDSSPSRIAECAAVAGASSDVWVEERRLQGPMLRQMNHPSEALDRRGENISDAPLGLNELRHAWIVLQLTAEAKNLHVDAAIEDVFMDSSGLQKMLAAERALGSVEEGDEQRIFTFGQRDLNAAWVGEAPRAKVQSPARKLVASAFVVAGRDETPPV